MVSDRSKVIDDVDREIIGEHPLHAFDIFRNIVYQKDFDSYAPLH